jgi:hypothetical protein
MGLYLDEHQQRHRGDVERIQRVAFSRGLFIGFFDAYAAWNQRSERMAANWLNLPEEDDELFELLKRELS